MESETSRRVHLPTSGDLAMSSNKDDGSLVLAQLLRDPTLAEGLRVSFVQTVRSLRGLPVREQRGLIAAYKSTEAKNDCGCAATAPTSANRGTARESAFRRWPQPVGSLPEGFSRGGGSPGSRALHLQSAVPKESTAVSATRYVSGDSATLGAPQPANFRGSALGPGPNGVGTIRLIGGTGGVTLGPPGRGGTLIGGGGIIGVTQGPPNSGGVGGLLGPGPTVVGGTGGTPTISPGGGGGGVLVPGPPQTNPLGPIAKGPPSSLCRLDQQGPVLTAFLALRAKVCQLTDDLDPIWRIPTASRSRSEFAICGADLGFPVEWSETGTIRFLFGDANYDWDMDGNCNNKNSPALDPIAWTSITERSGSS